MAENKNKTTEITTMLQNMGRCELLSCGSGFYKGVIARIEDYKAQYRQANKAAFISLSVLILLLVINVFSFANAVWADQFTGDDIGVFYLFEQEQISQDSFWIMEY